MLVRINRALFYWAALLMLCTGLLAGCQPPEEAAPSPLPTASVLVEREQTVPATAAQETALPIRGPATALATWATTARPSRTAPPAVRTPMPLPRATRAGCQRIPLGPALTREDVVEEARRHLAGWLGVVSDEVELVRVKEPTPPAPLKEPDRAYPDEPGPTYLAGYRLFLAARGRQYEYEVRGTWLIFCPGQTR
jgi:hypothetical protein